MVSTQPVRFDKTLTINTGTAKSFARRTAWLLLVLPGAVFPLALPAQTNPAETQNVVVLPMTSASAGTNFLSITLVNPSAATSPDKTFDVEVLKTQVKELESGHRDLEAKHKDLESKEKDLESKQRDAFLAQVDNQGRVIQWFAFLAAITAIIAVAGGFIPFLLGRKEKEAVQADKRTLETIRGDVQKVVSEAQDRQARAAKKEEEFQALGLALAPYKCGFVSDEAGRILAALERVEKQPAMDFLVKLRADAITASEARQADRAYTLWVGLAGYAPQDPFVYFNAGYWAQELTTNGPKPDVPRWRRLAHEHYQAALAIKPDFHEAAYNWGNVLSDEADVLAKSDVLSARVLWRQAGEKYAQALQIKPDKHEAYNNWGIALDNEGIAVAPTGLETARALWAEAIRKYQACLAIKPDSARAHFNLACVHARIKDVSSCCRSLAEWKKHHAKATKADLRAYPDFDGIRPAAEFQEFYESLPD